LFLVEKVADLVEQQDVVEQRQIVIIPGSDFQQGFDGVLLVDDLICDAIVKSDAAWVGLRVTPQRL